MSVYIIIFKERWISEPTQADVRCFSAWEARRSGLSSSEGDSFTSQIMKFQNWLMISLPTDLPPFGDRPYITCASYSKDAAEEDKCRRRRWKVPSIGPARRY